MKRFGGLREIREKPVSGNMLWPFRGRSNMSCCRSLVMLAFSLVASHALAANPFAEMSDEELTTLTRSWDELTQEERRALLTEVRARMASSQSERPVIQIKTERRYGHVVQRPDGSVVRIERHEQIVQYRRAESPDEEHAFGVGFEHRIAELEARTAADDADVEPSPQESAVAPAPLPVIRANSGQP
jgi:hypothetical protein